MIVLDTNVISELFRPVPDARVLGWIAARDPDELYTTAITEAEIFRGIEFMPAGRRRSELFAATEAYFRKDLAGRILGFESAAARSYAEISAIRKRKGLSAAAFDMQIAAIARTLSAAVATRNAKDFELTGVHIINPWNG